IISAVIIFPRSQGIASIAFLSMLLIPSLNKILSIEEKQDSTAGKFSLKKAFRDHNDVIQVYFMLFLGIFLAYSLASIKFPNLLVTGVFDSQLRIIGVNVGQATGGLDFGSILANNFKILIIFTVLSLVFGAGSIFFLAWNASVWGVVFAYVTKNFDAFFLIFLKITPHMFLEVGSYFFAIIGGGILSQAVLREKFGSSKFNYVLKDGSMFLIFALILLVLGAFVEVYAYQLWA
ncbi:MAG TPA: stage II sporulation protein M, partial [Allocoleopsis sp.]